MKDYPEPNVDPIEPDGEDPIEISEYTLKTYANYYNDYKVAKELEIATSKEQVITGKVSISKKDDFFYNGIVINQKNGNVYNNQFYGLNFNDFYYDWRSAKYGLSTMSATGDFYDKVSRSTLIKNEYSEIE